MPVTLHHRVKTMRAYNLDHAHYCAALGHCECATIETRVMVRKPVPGLQMATKSAPAVLTLLGSETKPGLPLAILQAPDIAAAVRRGDIRATTVPEIVPYLAPAPVQIPAPFTPITNSAPVRARK
jgi:hypothetical protein